MHIERFLRVSRAYLRASPAVVPRLEPGHGQLWSYTSARAGHSAQRGTSVASLWTTITEQRSGFVMARLS